MERRTQFSRGGSPSAPIRFGPFELDVRAGELRNDGRWVRLQDRPFQILRMLLECPGEVVLREEIRNQLWPNDTVVEFYHSINTSVMRLRDAPTYSAGPEDDADRTRVWCWGGTGRSGYAARQLLPRGRLTPTCLIRQAR